MKIARLFKILTKEVSLVDNPAIDEHFTEVKKKDTNPLHEKINHDKLNQDLENGGKNEMTPEQIKQMVAEILKPVQDAVSALTQKVEGLTASGAEGGKNSESLSKDVAEVKAAIAGLEDLKKSLAEVSAKLEETIEDAGKRFENVEKKLGSASSQKISGQEEGGTKSRWPSLTGRISG